MRSEHRERGRGEGRVRPMARRSVFPYPPPSRPIRGDRVTVSVADCARCSQDHAGLEFVRLANPIDLDFPFWAPCPNGKGPVILINHETTP